MESNHQIERHPFQPFLPEKAKLVMCGTFPPKPEKWSMDFFYPNFQNDMWRIMGQIIYNDKEKYFNRADKTVDRDGIKKMLNNYGIAISETATEVIRLKGNASDKFLLIVKPVALPALMKKLPNCHDLATTGEKAAGVIAELTDTKIPRIGEYEECNIVLNDGSHRFFRHWRMPSTSRAYPMKFDEKAYYYKKLLTEVGII